MRRLHPLLQVQLRELRARTTGSRMGAHELLEMLSRYYDSIDDERRAMVRSMQLMSDEARSLGVEMAEQGAAQLQVILDHIKDVVITVDAQGVIDRANPMTERVFAYPPGELPGLCIDALVPGVAVDGSITAGLDQLVDSGDTFRGLARSPEVTARRSDGSLFPAEIAVSRARNGRNEVFVICLRDISERHNNQEALRDSEARYRSLVDNAPEAITVIDADTTPFVEANEPALRLFKLTREQLLASTSATSAPRCRPMARLHSRRTAGSSSSRRPANPRCSNGSIATPPGARFPASFAWCGSRAVPRRWCAPASPTSRSASAPRSSSRTSARFSRCSPRTPPAGGARRHLRAGAGRVPALPLHDLGVVARRELLRADDRRQLPPMLAAVLERTPIEPRRGSCAAAVYSACDVFVSDVANDAHWADRRQVVLDSGFRAVWSMPIKGASGKLLGSVAIFRPEPGLPGLARTGAAVACRAARGAGHRAQPGRGGAAQQRGQVPWPVRGCHRGRLPEHARRPAGLGEQRVREDAGLRLGRGDVRAAELGDAVLEPARTAPSSCARSTPMARSAPMEVTLRRRDGTQVVALENSRGVRDGSGRIVGYEGTVSDITERKRAEQAMFAEKDRAQVTLQSIGDAVITTDAERPHRLSESRGRAAHGLDHRRGARPRHRRCAAAHR